jgi:putative SOS response-associated peptidase YedK
MCYKYSLGNIDEIKTRYKIINPETMDKFTKKEEIIFTPRSAAPIIIATHQGNIIEIMQWGLIPSWSKDPKIGQKLCNARAETLSEKPSFKNSLKNKRCIIPATGFYEWEHKDGNKIPYHIKHSKNGFLSFAGLYDEWLSNDGSYIKSYSLITTNAPDSMIHIHERSPLILKPEVEEDWLSLNITGNRINDILNFEFIPDIKFIKL